MLRRGGSPSRNRRGTVRKAATYDEIRLLWRESEDRHLALSGLLFAAAFYADNGRPPDTADCLDILHTIAQDNNNPESRATLRSVAAEAAQAEGDTRQTAHEFQGINFRNGGSAEGSLARRGGRSIPIGLDLPTQHSQRPLAAPALSQAILSEVLGRRPGRNGLPAVSQAGHFASAIWKFLSAFALKKVGPAGSLTLSGA
jgi:hypothetical protein